MSLYPDPMPDIGSYPVRASSAYVTDMVGDLNGRDGEFEGPLPHWISKFGSYELRSVPVAELLAAGYDFSPDLAREYAAMDPSTRPPVVFDPIEGVPMDGTHRARAAQINEEADVACYVGLVETLDPLWSEWEED